MTRAEDATVLLRGELMKLRRANPFEVLGVPMTASTEEVRQAFLAATKRRHPNRFAREAPEIRDLANELFLVFRSAYDQLLDETRRRALRDKLEGKAPTARSSGQMAAIPVPPAAQQQQAIPSTARPTVPAIPRAAIPSTARPTVPAIPTSARPTVPAMPASRVSGTNKPFPESRPIAPITAKPAADVNALLEQARERVKRYDDAIAAMGQGRHREAREALLKLATEEPQTKRFRVALHLAWGHEHRNEGRADDAAREFERALALDPGNSEVAEAQRKLEADRKRGLFTKIFGR